MHTSLLLTSKCAFALLTVKQTLFFQSGLNKHCYGHVKFISHNGKANSCVSTLLPKLDGLEEIKNDDCVAAELLF